MIGGGRTKDGGWRARSRVRERQRTLRGSSVARGRREGRTAAWKSFALPQDEHCRRAQAVCARHAARNRLGRGWPSVAPVLVFLLLLKVSEPIHDN